LNINSSSSSKPLALHTQLSRKTWRFINHSCNDIHCALKTTGLCV